MFGVSAVTLVGNFADAAALRAAAAGSAGQVAGVRQAAQAVDVVYQWDGASTAADDGITVIKPNSIAPANPGRWVQRAIADQNTAATGIRVIAVAWGGAEAIFRSSDGWAVVGANATHVFFARPVVGV